MKKWIIAGLAVVFSAGAWAVIVPNPTYMDMLGGFIYNHGFINPGDLGLTFTNAGIRDVTISAGQLSGVDPKTGAVITNAANLLPLRAQSLMVASNVVAGGSFVGNGSGLSNLNANMISSGTISAASLPTAGNWNAGALTISNLTVTGLSGDGSGLSGVNAASVGGVDGGKIFTSDRSYQSVISNGVVTFKPLLPKEGMVQWLEGIAGNEWIDSKGAMNARLTGSYCGTFDNVNDYVELSKQSASNKTYVFVVYLPPKETFSVTAGTASNGISLCGGIAGYSDDSITFNRVNGEMRYLFRGGGTNYTTQHCVIESGLTGMFSGQWRTMVVRKSLDENKFYLNIGPVSATYSPTSCPITQATGVSRIGYANNGGVYSGYMGSSLAFFAEYNRCLSDQDVAGVVTTFNLPANAVRILPFSEGAGTVIYDVSGNGNHGILVNANQQTFWGSTQDLIHYNLQHGFTKTNGVYVPAIINLANTDALGGALSAPAGSWHNGAETKIVQSTSNAALKAADTAHFWYSSNGTPNVISYNNLMWLDSSRIFANTTASGAIKCVLTYGTDLNGSFLDQAQGYIGDTEKQVSMYAQDGFNFSGGPITGNGSGLTNLAVANLTGAIDQSKINGLVSALADKANSTALAAETTARIEADTDAGSRLTTAEGNISALQATNDVFQARLNGLGSMAFSNATDFVSTVQLANTTSNFIDRTATSNMLTGELVAATNVTVHGAFTALYVPPQGDLLMGSFTNGLPQ